MKEFKKLSMLDLMNMTTPEGREKLAKQIAANWQSSNKNKTNWSREELESALGIDGLPRFALDKIFAKILQPPYSKEQIDYFVLNLESFMTKASE